MKKFLSILALSSLMVAGNVEALQDPAFDPSGTGPSNNGAGRLNHHSGNSGAGHTINRSSAVVQANLLRLKNGQTLTAQQKSDFISNVQKLEREKASKRRLVAKSLQRGQVPSKEVIQAAINEGRNPHGLPIGPSANTKPIVF